MSFRLIGDGELSILSGAAANVWAAVSRAGGRMHCLARVEVARTARNVGWLLVARLQPEAIHY